MNLTPEQLHVMRAALIAARQAYCSDMCEHGSDGMETPHPDIKAAMELLGMQWQGDLDQIFHGDEWDGNKQFKVA
jgi:hypothetical protein